MPSVYSAFAADPHKSSPELSLFGTLDSILRIVAFLDSRVPLGLCLQEVLVSLHFGCSIIQPLLLLSLVARYRWSKRL